MEDIAYWYKHEILRWRSGASVAWTILLLPVVTTIAVVVTNFHPFSPLQPLSDLLCFLLPKNWTFLLILAFITCCLAIWESKYYSVHLNVLSTRTDYIWNVLSPSRLFFTIGHIIGGGVATWCFLNLIGGRFNGLSGPCPEGSIDRCINEHHLFLVLHGATVGGCYALKFFLVPNNVLSFPIIQQSKFFQFKGQLYPTLISAGMEVIRQIRYYYIAFYIIIGPIFKGWVRQNLGLDQRTVGVVDSLYDLLDVGMLWTAIISGTLFQFLLVLSRLLYNIYQTEPFHFPVEVSFEEDRGRTLSKALACKLPILKYLAYQDFCSLSSYSVVRRKDVFCLSQPGGHPHNWVGISTVVLGNLQDLTNRLMESNNKLMSGGLARQLSGDKKPPPLATPNPTVTNQSFANRSSASFNNGPATPVVNLSFRGPPLCSTLPPSVNDKTDPKLPIVPLSTRIWEHLKKRKAVSFFISDLPDAESKRLFADGQMHVWAVEGISQLACASFAEDKFGVVQKSLPDIVSTLLSLQEAVEKHLKLAPNASRKTGAKGSPAASDSTQRHALKAAIKTSIYRLVNTFDKHISSIPLGNEHKRRLKLFMEYKE